MKSETITRLKQGIGVAGWVLAAVLAIILAMVLTGVRLPFGINHPEATSSSDKPAPAKGRANGESPEERETRLNGTELYNDDTPASKLVKLYTDALAESVKNKDVNACQTGLKNFTAKLNTMPWTVRIDLDEKYSTNDRQIPSSDTFLTTDHIDYACQQATRLDLMSDLKLSSSGQQAVEAIDSDYVTTLKDGPKVCFNVLSKDYRQAVGRSTAADRVMLGLTSLTLPQELTDEQFAILCDYKLPKV